MKSRPILFQGAMVRALLDGSKTQTRRIVKPRKDRGFGCELAPSELAGEVNAGNFNNCPYGEPGDRLWVRESYCLFPDDAPDGQGGQIYYMADQTDKAETELVMRRNGVRWRPSIHMPRAVCRIHLEIMGMRVELLQSMSTADLCEEGIGELLEDPDSKAGHAFSSAEHLKIAGAVFKHSPEMYGFAALWDSINGAEAWDANPWVWVIEFKRVDHA